VVGTDKSVEAPPGVSAARRLFHGDVAIPGTTLAGLIGFSERSVRRSGDIGSPQPPRRFHDLEAFRRSASRTVRRPRGGSRKLHRPLRVRAVVPSPVLPDRVAPPGVSRPFSDLGWGDPYHPGRSTARHHPSSGFLTLSTVCSPSDLADSLGPLPLMGLSLAGLFRTERPKTRRRVSCAPSSAVLYSLEL
jgi:hypothetical protein